MYFDETSKTGFTVHNHAIVVLLPPHGDLVSPNRLLLSQHWKTPVKVHNQRGTSGGSRSNGCLKCLHDFPSHLQSSPVSFILFSSQWKGQSPTHWSLDVDGGSRWGPSDRHMPSGVIIATCPVNTVVTFQLNKFQTLISPTVSLSTYLIQSENSWYQWWRTEPDTGVNLTGQTNNAFQVIKIKRQLWYHLSKRGYEEKHMKAAQTKQQVFPLFNVSHTWIIGMPDWYLHWVRQLGKAFSARMCLSLWCKQEPDLSHRPSAILSITIQMLDILYTSSCKLILWNLSNQQRILTCLCSKCLISPSHTCCTGWLVVPSSHGHYCLFWAKPHALSSCCKYSLEHKGAWEYENMMPHSYKFCTTQHFADFYNWFLNTVRYIIFMTHFLKMYILFRPLIIIAWLEECNINILSLNRLNYFQGSIAHDLLNSSQGNKWKLKGTRTTQSYACVFVVSSSLSIGSIKLLWGNVDQTFYTCLTEQQCWWRSVHQPRPGICNKTCYLYGMNIKWLSAICTTN